MDDVLLKVGQNIGCEGFTATATHKYSRKILLNFGMEIFKNVDEKEVKEKAKISGKDIFACGVFKLL